MKKKTTTRKKKKATPKKKGCKCVGEINDLLEADNTRLASRFRINFETGQSSTAILIATEKIDTKKRKAKREVLPTYCPFCGEKIPDE